MLLIGYLEWLKLVVMDNDKMSKQVSGGGDATRKIATSFVD